MESSIVDRHPSEANDPPGFESLNAEETLTERVVPEGCSQLVSLEMRMASSSAAESAF